MIKKRHILIVMGVLLIGFIIGSIFDYQIAQGIFQKDHWFSLLMSSFGVYPCYAGLAFISGGILSTSSQRKDLHIAIRILCYILSAAGYAFSVYLCGRELPSVNGYNVPHLALMSYGICAVLFAGVFIASFFLCKKGDAKLLWRVLMVMTAIWVMSLLPAGFVIKLIIHRPRYRYLVRTGAVGFHNWWDNCKNYKDLIEEYKDGIEGFPITKEDFKSFPSGHAGTGMVMAMILPYLGFFFKKLKGKETLMFYIGITWGAIMMFSRMLSGAHYFTDVCAGALIVMTVYFVVNFIVEKKGWLFIEEKPIEQPQE